MNVFSLIAHIGILMQAGRDVNSIVQNLVAHKEKFPSEAEFMKLIDDLLQLVGAGLIALPDDVTKNIADALTAVKTQLSAIASASA